MDQMVGKRFAAFLVAVVLLTLGFVFGNVVTFPSYATTIGLLYGAYLGGQSLTDYKTGGGSSATAQG